MAGFFQAQIAGAAERDPLQSVLAGIRRQCVHPVQLKQCLEPRGDLLRVFTDPGAELAYNAYLFCLLLCGQIFQFIDEGDDFERLHKGSFAGRGDIMDHPLDHPLGIHADRDNPAPRSLGNEVILEEDFNSLFLNDLLDLAADAYSQPAFGPTGFGQQWRGAIPDGAVMFDGCLKGLEDFGKRPQRRVQRAKQRDVAARCKLPADSTEDAQNRNEGQKVDRLQQCADRTQVFQMRPDVVEFGRGQ